MNIPLAFFLFSCGGMVGAALALSTVRPAEPICPVPEDETLRVLVERCEAEKRLPIVDWSRGEFTVRCSSVADAWREVVK